MFVNRAIQDEIAIEFAKERSKIVVVYGARQVGKTTLVESVLKKPKAKFYESMEIGLETIEIYPAET